MMRFVPVVIVVLLQACATGPAPVSPDAPAASRGSSAGSTPAVTAPSSTPSTRATGVGGAGSAQFAAVDGLLSDAIRLRQAGDVAASFSRLDRALRIAPRRAEVYLEFARSHQIAGNTEQAAASAQRGLLYCQGKTCGDLRALLESQ